MNNHNRPNIHSKDNHQDARLPGKSFKHIARSKPAQNTCIKPYQALSSEVAFSPKKLSGALDDTQEILFGDFSIISKNPVRKSSRIARVLDYVPGGLSGQSCRYLIIFFQKRYSRLPSKQFSRHFPTYSPFWFFSACHFL